MIFRPGVDGNSSGLFTPSRRASAGAVGRKREEDVIPAMTRPCTIADRRDTVVVIVVRRMSWLSVLGVGVEEFAKDTRDDASVILGERGVRGANALTEGKA
jgi:hypothetical protein